MKKIVKRIIALYRRFALTSILNFSGLVLAMLAFFIFITKAAWEDYYNSGIEDWKKIYRVEIDGRNLSDKSMRLSNVFAPLATVAADVEGVEDVSVLTLKLPSITFMKDGKKRTVFYQNGFGHYLDFWDKDIHPVFKKKSKDAFYVYVPRSWAEYYFGTDDVVGKEFSWQMGGKMFVANVACVYEDFPRNSCVKNAIYAHEDNEDIDEYRNHNYHVYVKTDEANLDKVAKAIRQKLSKTADLDIEDTPEVYLRWATDAYFSGVDMEDKGNEYIVFVLVLSAFVIVFLTSVNFVNFSMALAPIRMRDINTRIVLGATKWQVRRKMLIENIVVCVAAMLVTFVILYVLGWTLEENLLPHRHWFYSSLLLIISLVIGAASGWFAALLATSFPLSLSLKGSVRLSKRSRFMRDLRICLQLFCSYIIVALVGILLLQANYVTESNYGFDKDNVLFVKVNTKEGEIRKEKLREVMKSVDGVENVSFSSFLLGSDDLYMMWSRQSEVNDEIMLFTVMPVDYDYMATMGIDMVDGRDFTKSDKGAFVINKAMQEKYKWLKVNKEFNMGSEDEPIMFKIVGVCDNIRYSSFRYKQDQPLAFAVMEERTQKYAANNLSLNVRVKDGYNINNVQKAVEEAYKKVVPEEEAVDVTRLCDYFDELYHGEKVFIELMVLICLFYVLITLVGVFSQTLFECEYRRKEIGIRRSFGASTKDILMMMSKKYLVMLVVCAVVSLEIVESLQEMVLANIFGLSPYLWIAYPVAFVLVTGMVIAIVAIQVKRTVMEKPVKSIRNE